jgi:hypothetical protein
MQQITMSATTGVLPVLLIGGLGDAVQFIEGASISDCQRHRRGIAEGKEKGELKV